MTSHVTNLEFDWRTGFGRMITMIVDGVRGRETWPPRLRAPKSVITHNGERKLLVEFILLPNGSSGVIMRTRRKRATTEQNYVWRGGSSNVACSGSIYQIIMRFGQNTPWVSNKVVLEAHGISQLRE